MGALASCDAKAKEVESLTADFNEEKAEHTNCMWNCSVTRAEPFYRRRQEHEDLVLAQLSMLEAIERRLQRAGQYANSLRVAVSASGSGSTSTVPRTRSATNLGLGGFEIAGAGPGQDEYLSASSEEEF